MMRNHLKHEHHSLKNTSGIDRWALIIGIIHPLMTLPQILLIYSSQDASQVSFVTWAAYDIASVVLIMYGIKHSLTPIIVTQAIWLVMQTAMAASVFIF